jgi:sterol 3beta-glucosyltransferase
MGFGSHAAHHGASVVEAVQRLGLRAVVATGWGGITIDTTSENVHVVHDVPHSWLLPRTAAVVHHGGAGTSAAGLRAGRPTLICPVLGDQGFWAERIHALGAGPRPLPSRRITTTRLVAHLDQLLTDDSYRSQAEALSQAIRSEAGLDQAIRVIEDLSSTRRRPPTRPHARRSNRD